MPGNLGLIVHVECGREKSDNDSDSRMERTSTDAHFIFKSVLLNAKKDVKKLLPPVSCIGIGIYYSGVIGVGPHNTPQPATDTANQHRHSHSIQIPSTNMAEPKGADASNETSEGSTTMELNLRLDENGRTTYDPSLLLVLAASSSGAAATAKPDDDPEPNSKRAKIILEPASVMDYSSKTTLTNIASLDSSLEKEMNDLLFDCEITDCGLLPRTFWVPAAKPKPDGTSNSPRCYLEQLALEVFHHHVPSNDSDNNNFHYDPETSGAEWWVQLRPSPEGTGRYSMHANNDNDDDMAKSGISFHWDKDEDLRLMCGGSMYIHPHISTVTYLTDLGAPTMVLSKRVDPMTGQYVQEMDNDGNPSAVEGYVSWPKRGKHLSFDGRLLHAAPSDLMEEGQFDKQCSYDGTSEMDEKTKKILSRKHRRVTFLVNIWLNYKPFNVDPFPDTMIGNLSKIDLFGEHFSLFGNEESEKSSYCANKDAPNENTKSVVINKGKASILDTHTPANNNESNDEIKVNTMTWSMGQKDEESLDVLIPIDLIRSQQAVGTDGSGDVAITWNDGGVVLGCTGA